MKEGRKEGRKEGKNSRTKEGRKGGREEGREEGGKEGVTPPTLADGACTGLAFTAHPFRGTSASCATSCARDSQAT